MINAGFRSGILRHRGDRVKQQNRGRQIDMTNFALSGFMSLYLAICNLLLCGDNFGFAVWDGGEEFSAIRFVDDSAIKDNDYAGIGFASNQPAEALFEL